MGTGFSLISMLWAFLFCLAICVVVLALVRVVGQYSKKHGEPEVKVDAAAVTKRVTMSGGAQVNSKRASGAYGYATGLVTTYYITFLVDNGEHKELVVDEDDYIGITEGDQGKLSFKGDKFVKFEQA